MAGALADEFKNVSVTPLTEADKEDNVIKLIIQAGETLKSSILSITKALVLYHKFKSYVKDFQYESYLLACACLSINFKLHEEPIETEVLILTFYHMTGKSVENILSSALESKENNEKSEFETLQESLTMMETIILRMIDFDLNHQVGHETLLHIMTYFREQFDCLGVCTILLETAFKLASSVYLSNKCLRYTAKEIAVTAIQCSLLLVKETDVQFETHYKIEWLNLLSMVPRSTKQAIVEEIFKMSLVYPLDDSLNMGNLAMLRTAI